MSMFCGDRSAAERNDQEEVVYSREARGVKWRGSWWRAVLAELTGSALLVLLGCMGLACRAQPSVGHVGLVFGLVLVLLLQTFDRASGALLNPAVTLACVVFGRVPGVLGAAMAGAQLAGAVLGYGLLRALLPAAEAGGLCVTAPGPDVGAVRALLAEAALAGMLVLAYCASWDGGDSAPDSRPLRMGLVVAGLSVAGVPLTGAGMNPARSFAPAFWNQSWDRHWVYWVGPLVGSVVSTCMYTRVWRTGPRDVIA